MWFCRSGPNFTLHSIPSLPAIAGVVFVGDKSTCIKKFQVWVKIRFKKGNLMSSWRFDFLTLTLWAIETQSNWWQLTERRCLPWTQILPLMMKSIEIRGSCNGRVFRPKREELGKNGAYLILHLKGNSKLVLHVPFTRNQNFFKGRRRWCWRGKIKRKEKWVVLLYWCIASSEEKWMNG